MGDKDKGYDKWESRQEELHATQVAELNARIKMHNAMQRLYEEDLTVAKLRIAKLQMEVQHFEKIRGREKIALEEHNKRLEEIHTSVGAVVSLLSKVLEEDGRI